MRKLIQRLAEMIAAGKMAGGDAETIKAATRQVCETRRRNVEQTPPLTLSLPLPLTLTLPLTLPLTLTLPITLLERIQALHDAS